MYWKTSKMINNSKTWLLFQTVHTAVPHIFSCPDNLWYGPGYTQLPSPLGKGDQSKILIELLNNEGVCGWCGGWMWWWVSPSHYKARKVSNKLFIIKNMVIKRSVFLKRYILNYLFICDLYLLVVFCTYTAMYFYNV